MNCLSQVLPDMTGTEMGVLAFETHDLVGNQLFLIRSQANSLLANFADEGPIPCVLHTEHIAQIGVNHVHSFCQRGDSSIIADIPSRLILLCYGLILHEDRIEPVGNRIIFVESIGDVLKFLLSIVSVEGAPRVDEVAEESDEFTTEVFSHIMKSKPLGVLRLNLDREGADSQQQQCDCLQDHQLKIIINLVQSYPIYKISYSFTFVALKMHNSQQQNKKDDLLGASYHRGTLGHSLFKHAESSPGPAAYTIKSSYDNKKSGFSISPKKHQQKPTQKPDPWTYIPSDRNIKPRSPFATIGRQTKIQQQRKGPGPADYLANHNIVFHSIRRPIFGTERRVTFREKDGPGPATYDKISDLNQTYRRFVKIGREKRDQPDKSKKDIPAPNNYQQESDIDLGVRKRKGCSMGQKLRCKTEADFPKDYLKYNTDKVAIMRKMPAFTFQKSSRKQEEKDNVSPGPAAYFPHQQLNKGPKIGKSIRRLHSVTTLPGPQSYVVPVQHLSPSYSIPRNNFKNGVKNQTPAPNEYSPQLPQSKKYKSISIGVADRSNIVKEDKIPGPGQYNITVRSTKGFSIGKQERNNGGMVVSPGPAHYFVNPFPARSKSTRHL